MSIKELYTLLELNEKLMLEAIKEGASIKRLLELQNHRMEVLKCLLEHYETKIAA